MAEYIEREAVVRELNKAYDNMNAMGAQFYCGFMNEVYRIKDFHAADVAPVRHGSWLEVREKRLFGEHYFLCSNCKSRNGLMIPFNYCPNCGSKMDGELKESAGEK